MIASLDFEQPELGSNLELQSSRYHNSKALDEIYKINVGSHLGHGVEAAPAADNARAIFVFDVFTVLTFSRIFKKCSRPVQHVYFDVSTSQKHVASTGEGE